MVPWGRGGWVLFLVARGALPLDLDIGLVKCDHLTVVLLGNFATLKIVNILNDSARSFYISIYKTKAAISLKTIVANTQKYVKDGIAIQNINQIKVIQTN